MNQASATNRFMAKALFALAVLTASGTGLAPAAAPAPAAAAPAPAPATAPAPKTTPTPAPKPAIAPAPAPKVAAPAAPAPVTKAAPVAVPVPVPIPVAAATPAPVAKAAPAPAPGPAPKTNLTFQYIHDDIPSGPWSIHVFKVARAHSGWDIDTTLGGGNRFGLSVVSEQVKSIPPSDGKPVAAINGDFFESARVYLGDPEGLQIIRGELISGPNPTRACFYMDANGGCHRTNVTPQFTVKWPNGSTTPFGLNEFRDASTAVLYTEVVGPATRTSGGREIILERMGTNDWLPLRPGVHYTAKVREVRDTGNTPLKPDIAVISLPPALISRVPAVKPGDTVMVSTDSSPSLAGARTALGGGPSLVQNGKARDWGFFQMRHPRAVIGWSKDFFYLVVVDGRQRESVGMTYTEVGNYLVKIGCEEAINLDGGGSTTLWAFGQVMNSPSLGRERPSANALVILQTKKPEAGTNAPPAK